MSVGNKLIKNILIVDDDDESLEINSRLIKDSLNVNLIRTKYPSRAINLALNNFFDIILIDVTINYQGSPFGGLEIYNSLIGRYGDSSIIAYSKFITDDLLRQYNYHFNFIERGTNINQFSTHLVNMIVSLRKNQKCFIAMPFDKKYANEYKIIQSCVEKNKYVCLRIDQVNFNESIVKKIFEEIRNSKIVIFFTADKNPNVFYEAGFAVALNKEILVITDSYHNLPFDVRDRNAIAYAKDLKKLQSLLMRKIIKLPQANTLSHE